MLLHPSQASQVKIYGIEFVVYPISLTMSHRHWEFLSEPVFLSQCIGVGLSWDKLDQFKGTYTHLRFRRIIRSTEDKMVHVSLEWIFWNFITSTMGLGRNLENVFVCAFVLDEKFCHLMAQNRRCTGVNLTSLPSPLNKNMSDTLTQPWALTTEELVIHDPLQLSVHPV